MQELPVHEARVTSPPINKRGFPPDEGFNRLVDELTEARAEVERLKAERLPLETVIVGQGDWIGAACNLLAVLHRDGGHHTGEVGFAQSCKDGMQAWWDRAGELDHLSSALTAAEATIAELRAGCSEVAESLAMQAADRIAALREALNARKAEIVRLDRGGQEGEVRVVENEPSPSPSPELLESALEGIYQLGPFNGAWGWQEEKVSEVLLAFASGYFQELRRRLA